MIQFILAAMLQLSPGAPVVTVEHIGAYPDDRRFADINMEEYHRCILSKALRVPGTPGEVAAIAVSSCADALENAIGAESMWMAKAFLVPSETADKDAKETLKILTSDYRKEVEAAVTARIGHSVVKN